MLLKKELDRWVIPLVGVIAAVGAATIGYGFFYLHYQESTEDAYIRGQLASVSSQIMGQLNAVYVEESDKVEQGQLLASLDRSNANNEVQKAKAELALALQSAQRDINQYNEAKSLAKLKQAELVKARFDLQRRQGLAEAQIIAKEEFEQSHIAFAVAQAADEVAKSQLESARLMASTGNAATHPSVLLSLEKLRFALLSAKRCDIHAPIKGLIAKKNAPLGASVDGSRPLFAIAQLSPIWVEANFKETQLGSLRVGQKATVVADIYGQQVTYHAKVAGLGAGTGSLFALLPPQNATGNWIKIVQRVPVRLDLDEKEILQNPLCLGASITVQVDTHDRSGIGLMAGSSGSSKQVTEIYQNDESEVEKEVEEQLRYEINQLALPEPQIAL